MSSPIKVPGGPFVGIQPGEIPVQPNILLIKPDDMGREQFRLLGLGTAPYPKLPTVERLMQNGVTFTRAYVNPQCSPTRALWNTGCYGFRTGINTLVEVGAQPLLPGEVCLPAAIDYACGEGVYSKALFGKYHLSDGLTVGGEEQAPIRIGYDYFDGQLRNLEGGQDYFNWKRTIAARTTTGIRAKTISSTTYSMTQNVDSALEWIERTPQPWFIDFCPNLPHGPYARPPSGFYDATTWSLPDIIPADGASLATKRNYFKGCEEALDFELGRFLRSIPKAVLGNTVIVFWPDNGTSPDVVDDNVDGGHVKRSVFELGCCTPMIVAGPGVSSPGRQSSAIVHAVDLWATVLEVTKGQEAVPLPSGHARDSVSFWPVVQGLATTHRTYAWLEISAQGANLNCSAIGARAVVYERYKLMKGPATTGTTFPNPVGGTTVATDQFFDLAFDPTESQNLIGAGSPFVSGTTITLTNVHPDHPGALTAYQTAAAQYAAQTTSL